jgi:hypothetical protein
MTTPIAEDLRAWARGSYPIEAATELLIRAFRGRFAQPGHPWNRHDGRYWIDFDAITDPSTAAYSGGEQRLLAIAASLGGCRRINLGDVLASLDRSVTALVLAAVAHAAGSHQHCDVRIGPATGNTALVELDAMFPWPGDLCAGPGVGLPGPDLPTRPTDRTGTVLLTDSRGRVSTHPPTSESELAQAARTVRRLSDTTTPNRRGSLLYDVVRAVYDSVKFTAVTVPGEREALAEVVDVAANYRSSVWNQQHRS